ncbi:thioesterase family protein [Patulibacter sp.]|uniref:acyl-CoA thioesterase n=1 Tax=Patulibacter sp. TaxID=1912859 RepID=UPI002717CF42|nr:thioesterase family protein [Patulibacter sp.]MDO9407444.1 thioesterase family protein [Patulibacter sp.]
MGFVHELRVRYVECDMQGHVFNAHYVTWMDIAHTELWRAAVGPYAEFADRGLEILVAEVGARFRAGARFDDDVAIEVVLEPLTTSSMTSRHTMRRGDTVLAETWVRHVCVDGATHAKQPWPDDVRDALADHVVLG